MKSLSKLCPECGDFISYNSKRSLYNSIRNNSVCIKCRCKKQVKHTKYVCPCCNKEIVFKLKSSLYRAISKKSLCKSCSSKKTLTELWSDDNYRHNITEKSRSLANDKKFCSERSKEMKKRWEDDEFRKSAIKISLKNKEKFVARVNTPHAIAKRAKITSDKWEHDTDYRNNIINKLRVNANKPENIERSRNAALKQWSDGNFREKMKDVIDNMPKVSSQQEILYSILDDLDIEYFRERNGKNDDPECRIGPYSFDCVIPYGDKTILIEVQGEYWHSKKENSIRDAKKLSYINNNFPNHEVKYIWDHEFLSKDRVIETIKYWLNINKINKVDFEFDDIIIKKAESKEYKPLLSKYHYLNNAGRGGIAIGAYHDKKLIAVCIFSPMIRYNIDNNAKELSRMCIHPSYQKKNFGSWFISRSLNLVKRTGVIKVISYCDTTYNHDGSVYRASNFRLVGEISPDYWYVDDKGWIMHKKTLYNRAIKMNMKEKDYANKHNLVRVFGKIKLKFEKYL